VLLMDKRVVYEYGSVLQCVVVCCSVLQCVAVGCSVLQCVAVCCSVWTSRSYMNEACHISMRHVTYE